jgi:hypothetical protein
VNPANSPVPIVKGYVTRLLQDSPLFADVNVTYGHPGRDAETDGAWIGTTDEDDTEWAVLSADHRTDEVFSLLLYIETLAPGNDQESATNRVFELYEAVRSLVNADPTLDGALITPCEVKRKQFREGAVSNEGRGASMEIFLRCRARSKPQPL